MHGACFRQIQRRSRTRRGRRLIRQGCDSQPDGIPLTGLRRRKRGPLPETAHARSSLFVNLPHLFGSSRPESIPPDPLGPFVTVQIFRSALAATITFALCSLAMMRFSAAKEKRLPACCLYSICRPSDSSSVKSRRIHSPLSVTRALLHTNCGNGLQLLRCVQILGAWKPKQSADDYWELCSWERRRRTY